MERETQCKAVLAYMRSHGGITPMEAEQELDCRRLAARISDLRRSGYDIATDKVRVKKASGAIAHYARYRLVTV